MSKIVHISNIYRLEALFTLSIKASDAYLSTDANKREITMEVPKLLGFIS